MRQSGEHWGGPAGLLRWAAGRDELIDRKGERKEVRRQIWTTENDIDLSVNRLLRLIPHKAIRIAIECQHRLNLYECRKITIAGLDLFQINGS